MSWTVTDTAIKGRKSIFDMTEGSERHIGTLVAGSKKQSRLFDEDALLVSAAPDLYDALHAIMEHHGPGTLATDEIYENAVRALCKAQGKTFPQT